MPGRRRKVGGGELSVSQITAREKQRKCLELRKAGASFRKIAEEVGYSDGSAARKAVQVAMAEVFYEPAVELRSMQLERLNMMLLGIWARAITGDDQAIGSGLRIMDQMNVLMGVNAAQEVNVHHDGSVLVVEGNKDHFIETLAQMAGVDPKEIEAASVDQMHDIVDAIIIEDEEEPAMVPLYPQDNE